MKKISKTTKNNMVTYLMVLILFVIMQILVSAGSVSSLLQGLLVPLCAYIILAVSLNLTVGILGELSLGHAGFASARLPAHFFPNAWQRRSLLRAFVFFWRF